MLQALAAPSRLLILAQLRDGPLAVTTLSEALGLRQPSVSHHLGLLRAAGLVSGVRDGRSVFYRLRNEHVTALLDAIVRHGEHVRAAAGRE